MHKSKHDCPSIAYPITTTTKSGISIKLPLSLTPLSNPSCTDTLCPHYLAPPIFRPKPTPHFGAHPPPLQSNPPIFPPHPSPPLYTLPSTFTFHPPSTLPFTSTFHPPPTLHSTFHPTFYETLHPNFPPHSSTPAISSWRDDCAKELSTHWSATDKVARKGLRFRDGNYARAHDWDARLTYDGRRRGNENGYF